VRAHATGGRHYRGNSVDQNFDIYSVEYTFPDGAKLFFDGRCMTGCHEEFASYAHGTKGSAIISTSSHTPQGAHLPGTQYDAGQPRLGLSAARTEPVQLEWDDLIEAIRQDKPYNEVKRGAMASLVTSMGRMAAHTGQIITYEEILQHPHEFAPGVDQFTADSPAPIVAGPMGNTRSRRRAKKRTASIERSQQEKHHERIIKGEGRHAAVSFLGIATHGPSHRLSRKCPMRRVREPGYNRA